MLFIVYLLNFFLFWFSRAKTLMGTDQFEMKESFLPSRLFVLLKGTARADMRRGPQLL